MIELPADFAPGRRRLSAMTDGGARLDADRSAPAGDVH
jgi:hypothetical protein